MGLCFSAADPTSTFVNQPTAQVIALEGSLREYSIPTKASDVLSSAGPYCFLCISDSLQFDSKIPAMGSNELLQPGQIYFVLPISMLERSLSCSDMAALVVKASSGLASGQKRRRIIKVMPAAEVCEGIGDGEHGGFNESIHVTERLRIGMVSRHLRQRLNTIPEVPE